MNGTVTNVMVGGNFEVVTPEGHKILARLSGRDAALSEFAWCRRSGPGRRPPYDPTRGLDYAPYLAPRRHLTAFASVGSEKGLFRAQSWRHRTGFSATATTGKPVKLSELRGKRVVMFFFPKAMTTGCTIETRLFRDHYTEIAAPEPKSLAFRSIPMKAVRVCQPRRCVLPMIGDSQKTIGKSYDVMGRCFRHPACHLRRRSRWTDRGGVPSRADGGSAPRRRKAPPAKQSGVTNAGVQRKLARRRHNRRRKADVDYSSGRERRRAR